MKDCFKFSELVSLFVSPWLYFYFSVHKPEGEKLCILQNEQYREEILS